MPTIKIDMNEILHAVGDKAVSTLSDLKYKLEYDREHDNMTEEERHKAMFKFCEGMGYIQALSDITDHLNGIVTQNETEESAMSDDKAEKAVADIIQMFDRSVSKTKH